MDGIQENRTAVKNAALFVEEFRINHIFMAMAKDSGSLDNLSDENKTKLIQTRLEDSDKMAQCLIDVSKDIEEMMEIATQVHKKTRQRETAKSVMILFLFVLNAALSGVIAYLLTR
jgi:hypothetical protein